MEEHPWESVAKRLREKGKPFTFENFLEELEKEGHGYYFFEGEMRKGKPVQQAAKKEALLSQLRGEIKGEKSVFYMDRYTTHLRASLEAYRKLKEKLGDKLKAFAIKGGTLTFNLYGVPVKKREKGTEIGRMDDLDLFIVVEDTKSALDAANILKEIEEKHLTPLETAWEYVPLTKEDAYMIPLVLPKGKPVAFFEGREYVERLLEECKKEGRCEEEKVNYTYLQKEFEKEFEKEVREVIRGKKKVSREIEENFEVLWRLFSTPALSEYVEKLRERYKNMDRKELRKLYAAVLEKYLEFLDRSYKGHTLILRGR